MLMKLSLRLRQSLAGLVACLAVAGSSALTLGGAEGTAWIGRPLDLSVQVANDELAGSPLCAQAEVFYGDSRVDAARVSTQAGPSGIRIRSGVVVNEPVVTVDLQLGCSSRVTRRYVLLAEQPLERLAEPVARAAPVVPPAGVASAPSQPPPAPTARPGAQPRPAKPGVARAKVPAASSAQPRLRLDPLDFLAERDPVLKLSAELPPAPEATPQQRALAQALWRTLNAAPEEFLKSAQRVQALEGEVEAVRGMLRSNEAAAAELKTRLQQAQAQRYGNPWVYGLLALALVALAAAVYGWRRNGARSSVRREWWRPARPPAETDFGSSSLLPAASGAAAAAAPASSGRGSLDLDLTFTESALARLQSEAGPAALQRPAFQASSREDFQGSQPASLRAVRAEEVHDVQQEADFFASLGEYDRAIAVLRDHIAANPQTSAVAWLDLLEIYHKLERKDDYESVRSEFQRTFNADVPSFVAYRDEGHGLEAYPQALSRIEALWPSRKVLEVIEESIFRQPGQPGEAFSLGAYRELLLLHHIGRDILDHPEQGFMPASDPAASGFSHTSIHPLSASRDAAADPEVPFPPIGLDINLDETPLPSPGFMATGRAAPAAHDEGNMLDFDLPDVDSQFKAKKTRE
jgi:hypothetical protein